MILIHHQEWGNEYLDREDEVLLAAATEASYICFINNRSPIFLTHPGQRSSTIDLAFVSSSIFRLCEWMVLEDSYHSDHFPAVTRYNCSAEEKNFLSQI